VISGFVIPWAMYHAGFEWKYFFSFLLKRFARLEPPYLVSIVLALVILYFRERLLGNANTHIEVSAKQVALHLGYLIPFFEKYEWLNQVYWTLAIEFQYYFLIAILFIPITRSSIRIRIIFYCAFIAASFFPLISFLPHWLPLFLLGIVLFLYKVGKIQSIEYYSVSSIILVYGFYLYAFWAVIYALIPIIMILYFPTLKLRWPSKIGSFSYSIYLIHPLIGASLINVISHHVHLPWQKFLVICLGIGVTFLASWINYLLVEKPSKKLSASIKYKR
jgi:peptidoglycan/LPS O-acetylase OafA/YrhL